MKIRVTIASYEAFHISDSRKERLKLIIPSQVVNKNARHVLICQRFLHTISNVHAYYHCGLVKVKFRKNQMKSISHGTSKHLLQPPLSYLVSYPEGRGFQSSV